MRSLRRSICHFGRSVASVAAAAALGAACASSPSLSPAPGHTSAPPSAAIATASPTIPKATPTPSGTGWVPAGSVEFYDNARLVALAGGGCVLIGHAPETYAGVLTTLWEPATGAWRESARLQVTRLDYAAVGLADGRLLIAGGYDYRTSFASTFVLDPVSSAWTEVGSMAYDRTHAAAAQLPDGRVLVVGGYHYAPELEGRVTGVSLVAPRAGPGTSDGVPVFDSGPGPLQGRALATAELFDPDSGTWAATGPMRFARTGPAVITLTDGRVLVVGSSDDHVHIDDGAYRTAEIYDPATGAFELVGSLPRFDRSTTSGVKLPDGPPIPGILGSLVALPGGGAVLIGRQEYWDRAGMVVRSFRMSGDESSWREIAEPLAYVYGDEQNTKVSTMGSMVASLPDGSVLVAGGDIPGAWSWDEIDALPSDVRRYDPTADEWLSLPRMPEGRLGALGVSLSDGSVMLVGGFVPAGSGYQAGPEWAREAYRFLPGL